MNFKFRVGQEVVDVLNPNRHGIILAIAIDIGTYCVKWYNSQSLYVYESRLIAA